MSVSERRVAILQNQFGLGGRTKVVCEMIAVLNEMGIVPDVLSFTAEETGQNVGRYFGLEDLRYHYLRVARIPFIRGYLWQVWAINRLTRARHSAYDLVINSNDTLYGLNPDARYLHYIHYPAPGKTPYRYQTSLPRLVYGKLAAAIFRMSRLVIPSEPVYANSAYTRQAIAEVFGIAPEKIEVVYPPSFDHETVSTGKERVSRCMSVGSIVPEKRQLDQIIIAQKTPQLDFWIAGKIGSQRYLDACNELIQRENIQNVHIVPHMPYAELQAMLAESRFFLHTMKHEPFGISTVEAIAKGCIPIVDNSAGQREVVPLDDLRFDTPDAAAAILHHLQDQPDTALNAIQGRLREHIQAFSNQVFRQKMRAIFHERLGISP